MVGSHSTGDAATHRLTRIEDSYEAALAESQRADPILEGRRAAIKEHLLLIDAKLREVNENSSEVEEEIYQMLQDTLFQLQDETQKKMNMLLGEELELRRQYEQLDWIESHLAKQQERLGPVEFLNNWARHSQLRSVLHSFRYQGPRALEDIHADIRLVGNVHISSESSAAVAAGSSSGRYNHKIGGLTASVGDKKSSAAPSTSSNRSNGRGGGAGDGVYTSGAAGSDLWASSLNKHAPEDGGAGIPAVPLPISPAASRMDKRFSAYSLKKLAARRKRAWADLPPINRAFMFQGSQIVPDFEKANLLYNTLPVKASFSGEIEPPDTMLIYSSNEHGRSMENLHEQLAANYKHATVVLIKSRDYVFGGYASDPWDTEEREGERFGTTQCFLFSLNHNVKIPYHGRVKDSRSRTRENTKDYNSGYSTGPPTDALCSDHSRIQFGIKDLVIKENLLCSSELEFSYGLGLKSGSEEAKTFLAGAPEFDAELVEIWIVGKDLDHTESRRTASSDPPMDSYRSVGSSSGIGSPAGEEYVEEGELHDEED